MTFLADSISLRLKSRNLKFTIYMKTLKELSSKEVWIAPSLLAADFADLTNEIKQVEMAKIEILHLDIMDGHFVPNLTIGPPVVKSIRKVSNLIFDTHLMLTDPINFIEPFAKAGSNHITFHLECNNDIEKVIALIKKHSMTVGLSVRPKTSIDKLLPYLAKIDMVLIMTVEPGFGGQSFMDDMKPKIKGLKRNIDTISKPIHIQVDGGIDTQTIRGVVAAGANIIVAGTSVFKTEVGIKNAINALKNSI